MRAKIGWLLVAAALLAYGAHRLMQEPEPLVGVGPTEVRIATWNIKWLNAKDNTGMVKRQAVDYERLRRYARELDADVIALQEIDGPEAAARIFDPQEYAFHFPRKNQVQGTGFAYRRSLPVRIQPDLEALAKGRLRPGAVLSIKVGGAQLTLLAVHLKAGCVKGPLSRSGRHCKKLRAQLPVLEAWIDARAREETPFVVLGDFNRRFQGADPFWAEIDDSDPPNADLSAPTRGQTSRCWNGRHPRFIDHIVLGSQAHSWLKPDSFRQVQYAPDDHAHEAALSDHCPLSVVLDPARQHR